MEDSLFEADTEARVLLLVQLDEELGGVERALVTVPLHEVLERLLVLQDGAEAAKRDALKGVVA